jgi:hypothetical protein
MSITYTPEIWLVDRDANTCLLMIIVIGPSFNAYIAAANTKLRMDTSFLWRNRWAKAGWREIKSLWAKYVFGEGKEAVAKKMLASSIVVHALILDCVFAYLSSNGQRLICHVCRLTVCSENASIILALQQFISDWAELWLPHFPSTTATGTPDDESYSSHILNRLRLRFSFQKPRFALKVRYMEAKNTSINRTGRRRIT